MKLAHFPLLTFSIVILNFSSTLILSEPICQPPEESLDYIKWNDCEPRLDSLAWYGITKDKYTFRQASQLCQKYNGTLLMAVNEFIDKCAYFTMSLNNVWDEMVLYSGVLNCESGWEWCPYYWTKDCTQEFGYYRVVLLTCPENLLVKK